MAAGLEGVIAESPGPVYAIATVRITDEEDDLVPTGIMGGSVQTRDELLAKYSEPELTVWNAMEFDALDATITEDEMPQELNEETESLTAELQSGTAMLRSLSSTRQSR